jgi:hypothetical protein
MRQITKNKKYGVEVWTDELGNYTLKIGEHVAAVVNADDTRRIELMAEFLKELEK